MEDQKLLKQDFMNFRGGNMLGVISKIIIIVVSILGILGCYAEITGVVVDGETGEPIEGAVVLVEWTITKGLPGLTHTESYEVMEVISDKDGKLKISPEVINPLVNEPRVTVYKKGYVAWNNEYIFPDYKERKDFKWRDGHVFRLEKFKAEYSHDAHTSFISFAIRSGMGFGKKDQIKSAIEWEEHKALMERRTKKSE